MKTLKKKNTIEESEINKFKTQFTLQIQHGKVKNQEKKIDSSKDLRQYINIWVQDRSTGAKLQRIRFFYLLPKIILFVYDRNIAHLLTVRLRVYRTTKSQK